MDDAILDTREAARASAWSEPVETQSPAQAGLFAADAIWPPTRTDSTFIKGYETLPVIVPGRN